MTIEAVKHELEILEKDAREVVVDADGQRRMPELCQASPTAGSEPVTVDANGTYWVTGGTGALGLLSARWLVEQGAGQVVLFSRRKDPVSGLEESDAAWIKENSSQVITMQCDVANKADVQRCLGAVAKKRPLKGIIHSAGTLQDATLANQTPEHMASVMGPKAHSAWLLHEACYDAGITLDFYLLYSSIASLLGTASQANYAAANAYLDALASYRHSLGLKAMSIQWGPWDAGMAAKNSDQRILRMGGLKPIGVRSMQMIEDLINDGRPLMSVAHINWDKYQQVSANPLFASLVTPEEAKERSELEIKLAEMELDDRQAHIVQLVTKNLDAQLGAGNYDPAAPFMDMGIDSLGAVAFQKAMQSSVGPAVKMGASMMFDYPTVAALADYILESLSLVDGDDAGDMVMSDTLAPLAIVGMSCYTPGGSYTPDLTLTLTLTQKKLF